MEYTQITQNLSRRRPCGGGLRRFRFEVGMMLRGKTNASAKKDRFISPDVANPMSNLRNLCNLRIIHLPSAGTKLLVHARIESWKKFLKPCRTFLTTPTVICH